MVKIFTLTLNLNKNTPMAENKYLKVTKPDGTIHFVPFTKKAKERYEKVNSRTTEKVKLEEITEDEMNDAIAAKKLLDKDFRKSKTDLVAENAAKEAKIAELEAALAEKQAPKQEKENSKAKN